MAQWLPHEISAIGLASSRSLSIVLGLAFCALAKVFVSLVGSDGGAKPQFDIFLIVGVLAYSAGDVCASLRTKVKSETSTKAGIQTESGVPDGGCRQAAGKGSSADDEEWRRRLGMRALDRVLTKGAVLNASDVTASMRACVRCNGTDSALKLFDRMLESGAAHDAQRDGCRDAAINFFKLVADSLDDKRMREDGLKLLDMIRAHGLLPPSLVQNRLAVAWKSKLPHDVQAYFLKMRGAGVTLSSTAYRCIMVANELTNPELTLKLHDEMRELGYKLDRSAYNAVLSAYSQHGMLDQARALFKHMDSVGLASHASTYGIMMKVYSHSHCRTEALALFDKMRELRLEPNCFAYHHAIIACIKLQRMTRALELYSDMDRAGLYPMDGTYRNLIAACRRRGWTSEADRITKDSECARGAQGSWASPKPAGAGACADLGR